MVTSKTTNWKDTHLKFARLKASKTKTSSTCAETNAEIISIVVCTPGVLTVISLLLTAPMCYKNPFKVSF